MKKLTAVLLALSLLLCLAACGAPASQDPPATNAPQTDAPAPADAPADAEPAAEETVVKIGYIGELSGATQVFSDGEWQGILLGLEYLTNGTNKVGNYKIELIMEDDQSSVSVATEKAIKLIEEDGVCMLAGSCISANALAINEVAKQYEIPYLNGGAESNSLIGANWNEYTVGLARYQAIYVKAGASYLMTQGTTFAIIGPDTVVGHDTADTFTSYITDMGGQVLYTEFPPSDCTDFTSYLQAVKDTNAECFIFIPVGSGFEVQLPQQFHELGLDKSMTAYCDMSTFAFLESITKSKLELTGTQMYYYSALDSEANNWCVEQHIERYNAPPALWFAEGFKEASAIVSVLGKTASLAANDLMAAFDGLEFVNINGATCYIRPEDHVAVQETYILRVVDNAADNKWGDWNETELVAVISREDCEPPVLKG